jgi:hypothetical protein
MLTAALCGSALAADQPLGPFERSRAAATGFDDVNGQAWADAAAAMDIQIGALFVPTPFGDDPDLIRSIMIGYAAAHPNGIFGETLEDGSDTAAQIQTVIVLLLPGRFLHVGADRAVRRSRRVRRRRLRGLHLDAHGAAAAGFRR